jgi:hypothetical protein
MKPSSARERFLEYVDKSGGKLSSLTPVQGVGLMLHWYSEDRAEGCSIDQDGDMLLFQWGVCDWGDGEYFSLNITRQFIEITNDNYDGGLISQLSLTFRFKPDVSLRELPEGNRWCRNPDELEEFRRFMVGCPSWKQVHKREPATVTLDIGEV